MGGGNEIGRLLKPSRRATDNGRLDRKVVLEGFCIMTLL